MASLNALATMFNRLSLRTSRTNFGLYSCIRQHGILAENCNGERHMNPNKLTVQNGINSISPISLQKFQGASITSFYQIRHFSLTSTLGATLEHIHEKGPVIKRKKKNPLGVNKPFAKGIILRLLVKKPKKPNSANRKCVLVRLSTGKEMIAYIPGEGHNLQEHHVVLVRVGRLRDVPGVKLKCVRGAYDLAHVVKRKQQ